MYEGHSLIYPPNYIELADNRAKLTHQTRQDDVLRSELVEKIARPADATIRGLGDLAIQSMTGGILQPTYDTAFQQADFSSSRQGQSRLLGAVSLRDYIIRDTTPFLVTEAAIIGSAPVR